MSRIKKIPLYVMLALTTAVTMCKPQPINNNNMKTRNEKEIIVDVRTREEWEFDGHSDCSVNVPLDELDQKIKDLLSYDKITVVCRSGARAGVARVKLLNAGYTKPIENLGPWQNVVCKN